MDGFSLITYRRQSKGWEKDPIAQVHPCIVFGSGPQLTSENLFKYNITHVINCAFNSDSPSWFHELNPANYACIEALDSPTSDITTWYPKFERAMTLFLHQKNSKTIYVHCQCGINRSAYLTLIYICMNFGYKVEDALKMILRQRPCAFTNSVYMKQSIEYIKKHE